MELDPAHEPVAIGHLAHHTVEPLDREGNSGTGTNGKRTGDELPAVGNDEEVRVCCAGVVIELVTSSGLVQTGEGTGQALKPDLVDRGFYIRAREGDKLLGWWNYGSSGIGHCSRPNGGEGPGDGNRCSLLWMGLYNSFIVNDYAHVRCVCVCV